jgi:hypothetical protein
MEPQYIIDAAFGIIAFFVTWVLKRVYVSIDDLLKKHDETAKRITQLAIELPRQYVTKADLNQGLSAVHERFDKLEVKIDRFTGAG